MREDKLIIGTAQLGLAYGINNLTGKPSVSESLNILKSASEAGVKMLDTAEAYGDAIDLIGKYNSESKSEFKIVSKFGNLNEDTKLIENLKSSLEKLHTASIYAYLLHSPSDLKKLDEFPKVLAQIHQLKGEGLVEKIGSSIYTNADFKAAIENKMIEVIQIPFNVFDNNTQRLELLQYAKELGKEIHCRSVFLQGLIFKDSTSLSKKLQPMKAYIDTFKNIAVSLKIAPTELALNYALLNPLIDKVLIGVESEVQLDENLALTKTSLTQIELSLIDKEIKVKETELLYPYNWN